MPNILDSILDYIDWYTSLNILVSIFSAIFWYKLTTLQLMASQYEVLYEVLSKLIKKSICY